MHESKSVWSCESYVLLVRICNKTKTAVLSSVIAVFCDYYNSNGDCEWHYKPCGAACMKTCRNPSGNCSQQIDALEGKVEKSLFVMLHLSHILFSVWIWSHLTLNIHVLWVSIYMDKKLLLLFIIGHFRWQIICLAMKKIWLLRDSLNSNHFSCCCLQVLLEEWKQSTNLNFSEGVIPRDK